ncbi:MAG: Rne/Rng family ribonuclease [Gammaproteobacteria bacterium]
MSAELLVNVTPRETRVALIENGVLKEIYLERANRRGIVGNIFKGKVVRVLPGMQAAFVDIGLERAAFLHASDIADTNGHTSSMEEATLTFDTQTGEQMDPNRGTPKNGASPRSYPSITELVRDGQELLVQVIKDPIGTKGARLTTHISIPSCYLVLMPGGNAIGVSQRIEDEAERDRLRTLLKSLVQRRAGATAEQEETRATRTSTLDLSIEGNEEVLLESLAAGERAPASAAGDDEAHEPRTDEPRTGAREAGTVTPNGDGYIVRTAAELVGENLLLADMDFLDRIWRSVQRAAATASAPSPVHADLPLVVRCLREMVGIDIERARIDSRETAANMRSFCEQFVPEMSPRIEHYDGERPIFDLYSVEDEIQKALDRRVQLKSGGHLVIDQTEAMTTIDINTGAYVGHRNLEETIFKTNLEAAHAIARQLRLRNLGGIVIIDFIDMVSDEHKRQVLRALEKSLDRDPVKTQISEVSPLGLVQMTRKRTRESLEQLLCEQCPTCSGRGRIKAPDTVCYEIFRDIIREARTFESSKLLVIASQEVVDTIVDEESQSFAELEAFIGRAITLQVESMYPREQFDVVLM